MSWSEERKNEARFADKTARITDTVARAAVAVEDALRSLEGVAVVDAKSLPSLEDSGKYLHALHEVESIILLAGGGGVPGGGSTLDRVMRVVKAAIPPIDAPIIPAATPDPVALEEAAIDEEYSLDRWVERTKEAIAQEGA